MVEKWQGFPAKFSDDILRVIGGFIAPGEKVLDPFAGTGRIHEILHAETFGGDIEPEAAAWHPRTIVANALCQPWADETFDVIATSVTYANRMADSHNAQERCRACKGEGTGEEEGDVWTCLQCGGIGYRKYKRITYTHTLGHKLHEDNSGGMQWGKKYRRFHEDAWVECNRVLKRGGKLILNCSNHYRKGELQLVTEWHIETLESLGFKILSTVSIPTHRMGFGANRELRDDHETVAVFLKPY